MIYYLNGTIKDLGKDSVVLDVGNIAFQIYVMNSHKFEIEQSILFYIYEYVFNEQTKLIGFNDLKEKILFSSLLEIKGIGIKNALKILSLGEVEEIIEALNIHDYTFFNSLNLKITESLFNKYKIKNKSSNKNTNLIKEALTELGFEKRDIDYCFKHMNFDNNKDTSTLIKEALTVLKNERQ